MVEKDIVQRITFEEYGPEFRELYELMKNFFNLPQNIKENYKDAISPTNDPTSFQICDVGYSRSGGRETYQIRTGNAGVPWPNEEMPGFRNAFLGAFAKFQGIATDILRNSLANTGQEITEKIMDSVEDLKKQKGVSASVLRLAVYNEVDVDTKPLYELSHTDSGLITLCVLPEVGLEVSEGESDGPWEQCNEEEKECVVSFYGTALSSLSGGALPATHHRVKNTGKKRYSLVFFLRARPEIIGPRTEADFQIMLLNEKLSHVPESVTSQFGDMWERIMKSLDVVTLVRVCTMVCKQWNKIAEDNSVWNRLYVTQAAKNGIKCFERKEINWKKLFISDFGYLYKSYRGGKAVGINNLKAVFVGDPRVGKTCLITTACTGSFPGEYVPTGFDNFSINLIIDSILYNVGCWDTAGQQDYDLLRPLSYPQTDIFVVMFDITRRATFTHVTQKWIPEIRHHCPTTPVVLCATKLDLPNREVSEEEGARLAHEIHALAYFETSALTGVGVRGTFEQTANLALRKAPDSKKTKEKCSVS